MNNIMLNHQIYKEIISTVVPIILSNLTITLSGFVVAVIISHLGATALSACALIYSFMNILFMILFAFSIPIAILSAQMMSAQYKYKIKYLFHDAICILLIIGCILFIICRHFNKILFLFHQPNDVIYFFDRYFYEFSFGFFPLLITIAINQFLIGIGHVKVSFVFILLNCLINILLVYVFINQHFPSGLIGIERAGIAASISYWILFILQLCFLNCHNSLKSFGLLCWTSRRVYISSLLKLGVPFVIQRSAELVALFVMTLYMGCLGVVALSAQHIISQISMILLVIPFGFTQAAGILVSKASINANQHLIKKYIIHINIISFSFMILFMIIFAFISHQVINWFLKQNDFHLLSLLSTLLPIFMITLIFDNFRNITVGALRGLQDSLHPMIYSLISLWLVSLPCAYLFAFVMHFGAVGAAIGWMCGIIIGAWLVAHRTAVLVR